MKPTKYIGVFKNIVGSPSFALETTCFGFFQAFILLTAKAIESGKTYQLDHIIDEDDNIKKIADTKEFYKLIIDENKKVK